jgi:hypothetical protein
MIPGAVLSSTVAPAVQVPVLEARDIVGPVGSANAIVPEASAPPPTSATLSPELIRERLVLLVKVSRVLAESEPVLE